MCYALIRHGSGRGGSVAAWQGAQRPRCPEAFPCLAPRAHGAAPRPQQGIKQTDHPHERGAGVADQARGRLFEKAGPLHPPSNLSWKYTSASATRATKQAATNSTSLFPAMAAASRLVQRSAEVRAKREAQQRCACQYKREMIQRCSSGLCLESGLASAQRAGEAGVLLVNPRLFAVLAS